MRILCLVCFSIVLIFSVGNAVAAESAHAEVGWLVAAMQSLLLLMDEIKVGRWD